MQEFDIVDGKLDFEEVDEKYCISFVFKGDWKAKLEGPGSTPDRTAARATAVRRVWLCTYSPRFATLGDSPCLTHSLAALATGSVFLPDGGALQKTVDGARARTSMHTIAHQLGLAHHAWSELVLQTRVTPK